MLQDIIVSNGYRKTKRMDTKSCREELKESTGKKDISLPISRAEKLSNNNGGDSKIIIGDDDADDSSRRDTELWIAGRQASRGGWVRISDGTERVFYHHNILGHSPKITLERPPTFGQDDPTWADGMYKRVGAVSIIFFGRDIP